MFKKINGVKHLGMEGVYVNKSRPTYIFRFINIYMNVNNIKKSYNMKRRK
jgi:hypothetical protein